MKEAFESEVLSRFIYVWIYSGSYFTVTDFARLRGLSGSCPRLTAM
jgi:hypothetical protein